MPTSATFRNRGARARRRRPHRTMRRRRGAPHTTVSDRLTPACPCVPVGPEKGVQDRRSGDETQKHHAPGRARGLHRHAPQRRASRALSCALREEQRRPRFARRSFAINGAPCEPLGTGVVAAGMDELHSYAVHVRRLPLRPGRSECLGPTLRVRLPLVQLDSATVRSWFLPPTQERIVLRSSPGGCPVFAVLDDARRRPSWGSL
jgi:hypothetical protein